MTATIILTAAIGLYAVWVIRRKARNMKNGRFCSCGCEGCAGGCKTLAPGKKEKE